MGATNNIKEVIQVYQLEKRTCRLCQNFLTGDNYQISYRTNNDIDWNDFDRRKSRGWIRVEIELEHEECPNNNY